MRVCLCEQVETCSCMGTRQLSTQRSPVWNTDTNTVPFTHILTPSSQPSNPTHLGSHPLWPSLLTLQAPTSSPFSGSFWFPFWFLTSRAISEWPVVPLILPAHCVLTWAGPLAPGAGRGARNDLVPVAVLVKGAVPSFPLVTAYGKFWATEHWFCWGELSSFIWCLGCSNN